MKKSLLFLTLLITYQTSISQCERAANSFGNNTMNSSYNISGDVTVTLNTNDTVTLDLESNFSTATGPDVRAYLIDSKGASDNTIRNSSVSDYPANDIIEFGLITKFNGVSSFTVSIPVSVNILEFDKVYFNCFANDVLWDFGSYTPFTSENCTLSLEDNSFSNISISPNPANNLIRISSPTNELAQIRIFNTLGSIVYQKETQLNQDMDVSNLKSGIYILSATSDRKNISKKLVIK
ncbi:T9SS type A sorting domain-containing protein [Flavivirga jejuensis]|uniref:T9SS type A sorting domain-containing protein n=1 Tax=Flavivirga jejuensis TaxID=870487 RepID=A0ABT8WJ93_9FLAO|nr:T9SS type A sorting domain-containing protein [Flavivirga jejuensis]MDO5973216.1 T9SS type A sorting domain-containing protein [Flavivirga jejuensis]